MIAIGKVIVNADEACARMLGGVHPRACGLPAAEHYCKIERHQQTLRFKKMPPCSCQAHHNFIAPKTESLICPHCICCCVGCVECGKARRVVE